MASKKRRCTDEPVEVPTLPLPKEEECGGHQNKQRDPENGDDLTGLTVEEIEKQIELLMRLKISKQKGNAKGKRKLPMPLQSTTPEVPPSPQPQSPNESDSETAPIKTRRRFITQESVKDPQHIRTRYYERREELLSLYSGQWVVFGLSGEGADELPRVLGSGPSALAAYYAALPKMKEVPLFEVICVGSEDLVCRLPVKMVFNPALPNGADIYVC